MTSGSGEVRPSVDAAPSVLPPPSLGPQLPPTAAAHAGKDPEARPPRRRTAQRTRLLRRLTAAAAVLWSLGLLGLGLTLGYRMNEPDPVPPAEVSISVDPVALDALEPGGEIAAVMPAVLGLSEADARAVLADNGFGSSDITVEQLPRAGESGLVAAQQPAAGTELPGMITLSISSPAAMPDLTGTTRSEAEAAIRELGARPAISRAYEPGAVPDTVLATSPLPGEPVPELVSVTLASRAASLFLAEVPTVDSDCNRGEAKANGVESDQAVLCRLPNPDTTASISWDLSRRADRFTAQVGISDDSAVDGVARLAVVLDGVVIAEFDARFGVLTPIDVEVRDGLRLELRVTTLIEPSEGAARVVLLDPAVLGAEDRIDELANLA